MFSMLFLVILFLILFIFVLGLFMLKDWMIIILGGVMKFCIGMGILFMMYLYMMLMLYFSWVEMGMIGVLLVIVFCNYKINVEKN